MAVSRWDCAGCSHSLARHAPRSLAKLDLTPEQARVALTSGEPYPCWFEDRCACQDFGWKAGDFFEAFAEGVLSASMEHDAGLRTIRDAYRNMQVDKAWTRFIEPPQGDEAVAGGFRWWAGPLVQQVWAMPPFGSRGHRLWRVYSTTDLVKNIKDHRRVERVIRVFNGSLSLNAFVYDREERMLRLRSSAYVHEQNVEWLSRLFSLSAAFQIGNAHAKVNAGLAEVVGGEPAESAPPGTPMRTHLDDITELAAQVAREGKEAKSGFTLANLADAERLLGSTGAVMRSGMSLTALLPFSLDEPEDTAALKNFQPQMEETARVGKKTPGEVGEALWRQLRGNFGRFLKGTAQLTILLTVNLDVPHPQYGPGALMLLQTPVFVDNDEEADALAAEMNDHEDRYQTGAHGFGAWMLQVPGPLTHALFIPAGPGVQNPSWMPNVALSETVLARWASWYLLEGRKRANAER